MNATIQRVGFVALVLAVALAAGCRAPAPAGAIQITDAWARPTTMKSMNGGHGHGGGQSGGMAMEGPVSAAYMVIQNSGGADKLISASTDVAEVTEIHETKDMGNGMMGMQPVQGGLDIPANGSVVLKPGGYHIMFMKLKQELAPGQTIKLTLTFQSGKQITLDVPVKEPAQ
ncbi:MAG: copper chaperone PCu(A)C [Anaerolineae bacterium]|nr:copper chaperone PCu(A)C [Thermoflexales bacterium]MDW8407202.1 copper chaperone PCu(A)C [Anaerolineae bacterium]